MSEPNDNLFSEIPGMDGLDIDAIFGGGPGADSNPFGTAPAASSESPAQGNPDTAAQATAEDGQEPESQGNAPTDAPVENPISAAVEITAAETAKKGLFEKPAVFAYGSAKESISDGSMTFEELRIAKAEDFPELSEGKRVSWSVEYGKTVKAITDPKGTTIQSVKEEIERSKSFLDGLKKAKDKNPDCLVKPKVTAQSKGIAAYKGVFPTVEDARASDKPICLIPGGDGRVYEMRKTELGEFIVRKNNVVEFQTVRAGFIPALPLIPLSLIQQIISFFRCYMNADGDFEALAHILWDKELEEFTVYIPEQSVSHAHVDANLTNNELPEERYLHYADIHSHNTMAAKFSLVDDADEQATRIYMVLGRLDRFFPEITVRMSCGGVYQELDPAQVIEGLGETYPREWRDNVTVEQTPARESLSGFFRPKRAGGLDAFRARLTPMEG